MYSTWQLVLITTFCGVTVTALQWSTSVWSDCQIVAGACGPHTPAVPVYGHKRREVWCSNSQNGSVIPDKFCRSERRPHSSIVCFGHCPRCHGSWSSWSPVECQECVGRQRRQLECHQGDHKVIEEHRACFSPALCKLSSSSQASILLPLSEVITQPAISQQASSTALRPPEPLTAPFVPYLHVGAWSECQPQQEKEDEKEPMEPRRQQKKRKKRKNRKVPHRSKRNNFPVVRGAEELQTDEERVKKSWSPRLPSDLEISFVANSVPEPRHGVQTRQVQCRGQDGETLPFR